MDGFQNTISKNNGNASSHMLCQALYCLYVLTHFVLLTIFSTHLRHEDVEEFDMLKMFKHDQRDLKLSTYVVKAGKHTWESKKP